jgi:hypothetical protein
MTVESVADIPRVTDTSERTGRTVRTSTYVSRRYINI